ncbi:uncharacterized protein J3R85_008145 [Psidium guajava]|nr:uncharacterized protein J3R85_008145 [Psidium guajava]
MPFSSVVAIEKPNFRGPVQATRGETLQRQYSSYGNTFGGELLALILFLPGRQDRRPKSRT